MNSVRFLILVVASMPFIVAGFTCRLVKAALCVGWSCGEDFLRDVLGTDK